jgi:hypothetical protein
VTGQNWQIPSQDDLPGLAVDGVTRLHVNLLWSIGGRGVQDPLLERRNGNLLGGLQLLDLPELCSWAQIAIVKGPGGCGQRLHHRYSLTRAKKRQIMA